MPLKNGVRQVVKIFLTTFALIAVTVLTTVVVPVPFVFLALAMGAFDPFTPTQFPDLLITKTVINYFLYPE